MRTFWAPAAWHKELPPFAAFRSGSGITQCAHARQADTPCDPCIVNGHKLLQKALPCKRLTALLALWRSWRYLFTHFMEVRQTMESSKKVHDDWRRAYREHCTPREGECAFQVVVEETDLRVLAQCHMAAAMLDTVYCLRADIKGWMALHPEFRSSLVPLPLPDLAPEVVRRMYAGALVAGVGPFAAVAGAVAQMTAEAHVQQSPNLIVENGGDIFMFSQCERVVGLLSQPDGGPSLGLRVAAEDFPLSLCASSATIGHSLSLGQGDLAVVCAPDAAVADAVATALGNRLQGASDIEAALAFVEGLASQGVHGAFVQCAGKLGIWGRMELTAL